MLGRMRAAAAFVIAVSLTGCAANFDETTWVTVRHPSAVSVGVQTPGGGEWLLPANGEAERKEVPDSNPPLTEGRKFAQVTRDSAGQVSLDCPSCTSAPGGRIVRFGAPIKLEGTLEHNIRWDAEQGLTMRYSHDAYFPCYRHPSHDCPREAVALWLATPKENVVEVRHVKKVVTRDGERGGALIGIFVGGAADAIGLSFAGLFAFDRDARDLPTIGVASAFLAVGTTFLVSGILGLRARDTSVVVYHAPPP